MTGWRYVKASVIGSAHVGTGLPCQDHHAAKVFINGQDQEVLLLVTSDGAGSAAHSEEGSALACHHTLEWLEHRLIDGTVMLGEIDGIALVSLLRNQLQTYAEEPERNYALRDLACTLNAAAVLADSAWFVQVGDGATVIQQGDAPLDVVFWPDNGEYANQTYFITDVPDAHVHTLAIDGPIERVALMTDGLQSLALSLQQRAPHAPFFEPMLRAVEALDDMTSDAHQRLEAGLATFLNTPGVNARTSDDKTLILSSRRPPPVAVALAEETS